MIDPHSYFPETTLIFQGREGIGNRKVVGVETQDRVYSVGVSERRREPDFVGERCVWEGTFEGGSNVTDGLSDKAPFTTSPIPSDLTHTLGWVRPLVFGIERPPTGPGLYTSRRGG